MYEQTLKTRVAVLGSEHLLAAQTKVNIGNVLRAQGQPHEAFDMFMSALPVLEKALGTDQPLLADTRSSCANLKLQYAFDF